MYWNPGQTLLSSSGHVSKVHCRPQEAVMSVLPQIRGNPSPWTRWRMREVADTQSRGRGAVSHHPWVEWSGQSLRMPLALWSPPPLLAGSTESCQEERGVTRCRLQEGLEKARTCSCCNFNFSLDIAPLRFQDRTLRPSWRAILPSSEWTP